MQYTVIGNSHFASHKDVMLFYHAITHSSYFLLESFGEIYVYVCVFMFTIWHNANPSLLSLVSFADKVSWRLKMVTGNRSIFFLYFFHIYFINSYILIEICYKHTCCMLLLPPNLANSPVPLIPPKISYRVLFFVISKELNFRGI